jgi:hypothetical protein
LIYFIFFLGKIYIKKQDIYKKTSVYIFNNGDAVILKDNSLIDVEDAKVIYNYKI